MEIQNAWYRISVKALIYNSNGKILLMKEKSWVWDFPGGWLDHWENPIEWLKRELHEEMWLKSIDIQSQPSAFITTHKPRSKSRPWIANVFYETKVENFDFTASDECVEIWFFDKQTIKSINTLPNVEDYFNTLK